MSLTTNYSWTKPTVGGDVGAWGTELNGSLDGIDTQMKTTDNKAAAALPMAGGAMTGRADLKTATYARVDKGSINGAQSLDLSAAQAFTATATGAITWSVANLPAGTWAFGFSLKLTNGGTGAQTWPTGTVWQGGTAPTLTAAGTDLIVFITYDGGTTWQANALINLK